MKPTEEKATTGGALCADLFAPGMTALHGVGLAGLAMTLAALEDDGSGRSVRDWGDWQVDERSVRLEWSGNGQEFFKALFAASFRLTESGMIWLAALGHPLDHPGPSAVLHNAMLGTFLQHTSSRGSGKQARSIAVEVDEETYAQSFLPLVWYRHQKVDFKPARPMPLAGWLYPGGAVRHVWASAQTSLSEEPARALALLYAPVGAVYFQVHRRVAGVRPLYCVALPAVSDLAAYTEVRQSFLRQGVAQLQVSGGAEAAVRVLAELEARHLLRIMGGASCQVMAFGTVPWSKQQKSRVQCFTATGAGPGSLRAYKAATQALPPHLASSKPDPETGEVRRWWAVPQVPDLVARNIIQGTPWWSGFAKLWDGMRQDATRDRRDWVIQPERGGLQLMVENDALLTGPEARLVHACHDAWRRRLGALGERATQQGLNFSDLASREYERVRISLARCKSPAMLRQTLTDFWSRAGSLPDLREGWPEILPMLTHRWQESRDLALLALASYKADTDENDMADTSAGERATE